MSKKGDRGGLGLTVKEGDLVFIDHAGERLVVHVSWKKGSKQFGICFSGPMSFNIQREGRFDDKKSEQR